MLNGIQRQIERLKGAGATYVDARWYPFEDANSLLMWNGNLKAAAAGRESGIGVRVLYKGAWGFSAASDTGSLAALFDKAFDNARVAAERVTFPVRLAEKDVVRARFESPCKIDPLEVPLADKVAFLKAMDDRLNQTGVEQRIGDLNFTRKQIVFIDSEGSEIEKRITDVFVSLQVSGRDGQGVSHQRKYRLGRRGETRGWETVDRRFFGEQADRIVRELNLVLAAEACPKDARSVILLPGIMYLQTHETIGHALELDRILGYELAYAGGSFVTLDDFGTLHFGSERTTCGPTPPCPTHPAALDTMMTAFPPGIRF
jgi:TldD protein